MNLLLHYFPVISSKISVNKSGNLRIPTGRNAWIKKLEKPLESLVETNAKGEKRKFTPNLVYCPETKKIYIVSQNWRDYLENDFDEHLRALGPLDPIIWDRDQLHDFFNFDYLWEIYKPISERKWGYYHYPLLYQGKFIGRVEAKIPKSSSNLELYNFYPEKGLKFVKPIKSAFNQLTQRWKNMSGAESISFDSSLKKFL